MSVEKLLPQGVHVQRVQLCELLTREATVLHHEPEGAILQDAPSRRGVDFDGARWQPRERSLAMEHGVQLVCHVDLAMAGQAALDGDGRPAAVLCSLQKQPLRLVA